MDLRSSIRHAIAETLRSLEGRDGDRAAPPGLPSRLARAIGAPSDRAAAEFLALLEDQLVQVVASARVVVTGREWVGGSLGGVETALLDLVAGAEREVLATVYCFGSSVDPMLDALEGRLSAGIRVGLVVNDLPGQPADVRSRIERFGARYPHLRVKSFPGGAGDALHAKVVIADRRRTLIGSANLSRGGFVGNHEMGVVVEGAVVEIAAARIEDLLARLP